MQLLEQLRDVYQEKQEHPAALPACAELYRAQPCPGIGTTWERAGKSRGSSRGMRSSCCSVFY